MITADQLLVHCIGDYVLQSDWMANEKTKQSLAAAIHAIVYSIGFLVFDPTISAISVIAVTHFVIDRWRLARFVVFAKNYLAPRSSMPSIGMWPLYAATGYHKDRPVWLAVWLLIIADNVMHVVINGLALRFL